MSITQALRRLCAPLILTITLLAAMPAVAPAANPGLLARAVALTSLPHEAFATAPRTPPFDWSTDGCSRTPPPWARFFDAACRQHDFGYRNLGNGLRLQRTEPTRRWLDDRMLAESRRLCARRSPAAARALCDARAIAMHVAVRLFNPRWS